MDVILCDGNFERTQICKKEAKHIARSDLDSIACVYYCCEEHKESYEKQEFIMESYSRG